GSCDRVPPPPNAQTLNACSRFTGKVQSPSLAVRPNAQNAHEQQGVICSGEPAGKGVGQVQVGPGLLIDLNCRRDFLRL
ncbi:MAG TPA: hypothetical protein VKI17_02205, partial [Gemmataceae bacterium]|nr:hypothetical protein [Gemmataceae bacterium]